MIRAMLIFSVISVVYSIRLAIKPAKLTSKLTSLSDTFESISHGNSIAKEKPASRGFPSRWTMPVSLPMAPARQDEIRQLDPMGAFGHIDSAFDSEVGGFGQLRSVRFDDVFVGLGARGTRSSSVIRWRSLSFRAGGDTTFASLIAYPSEEFGMIDFDALELDDDAIRTALTDPRARTRAADELAQNAQARQSTGLGRQGRMDESMVVEAEIEGHPVELVLDNHQTVSCLSQGLIDEVGLEDQIYASEDQPQQVDDVVRIESLQVMAEPVAAMDFHICDNSEDMDGRIGRALREKVGLKFEGLRGMDSRSYGDPDD